MADFKGTDDAQAVSGNHADKPYEPITITHLFKPEDVTKYPDLMFQFLLKEIIIRATRQHLTLDQALTILNREAEFLESQITKATTDNLKSAKEPK